MKRGGSAGYDRHITVFSPEGRLYQVEYAKKASKNMKSSSLVLKNKNSILALIMKKNNKNKKRLGADFKIFPLTDFSSCIFAGFLGDIDMKIHEITKESVRFFQRYNQLIPMDSLANHLSDSNQIFTQYAYTRPLAVCTLIIGIDEETGPQIYKCEPSGKCSSHFICALGEKESLLDPKMTYKITQKLKNSFSIGSSIDTAMSIIKNLFCYDIRSMSVEILTSVQGESSLRKLTKKEIDYFIENS